MTSIILIGPIGVGKTTVGRLLAEKLDVTFCSIDDVRQTYYQKIGYDKAAASSIAASVQGIRGMLRYAAPFDAQMIEMVLADFQHSVIDFGASNSVYENEILLQQIENLLKPYANVILLLPSPDEELSGEILKNRLIRVLTAAGQSYSDELFELNRHFIRHPSNYQLAKRIIYTRDRTPQNICVEIMNGLVLD